MPSNDDSHLVDVEKPETSAPEKPETSGPSEPKTSAHSEQPGRDEVQASLEERLQRERAEFRNYKRRIEEARRGDRERASGETLQRILPLLDELDRAIQQVPSELADHPWVRGIVVARRQLLDAFRDLGVERFGAAGEEFDPALHEAVSFEPREDEDERRINEVHRPGYAMGRRLLRPARVSVTGPGKREGAGRSAAGEGRSE
jgi:molecular chaperone GrpE